VIHLLAASLIWAFSFGLIKGTLTGYDPLAVAAGRLVLSALLFTPWLGRVAAGRLRLAALGALQFGLMYLLYIASYRHLPAYAVALLTVFTPFYVILIDNVLVRRCRPRHLAAAAIAVAGAGFAVWRALPAEELWAGALLLQGANLCFAAGQVAYRRLRRAGAIGSSDAGNVAWMYLGAALFAGAAAVVGGRPADLAGLAPDAAWALVYLGLLPSGVAFWLWNRGAARTGAGILAVANNLKIPLGVLAAWLVFGEEADRLRVLVGTAVVLLAAALSAAGNEDR
jgi:drug/metabolite transporter (DMT)-like permease